MTELRLYLLRHAKAVAATAGGDDFERPLARAGWDAMAEMGPLIRAEGYLPDLTLCSSSRRTRETLAALLPSMTRDMQIVLSRRVYESGADDLLSLISETADSIEQLMVIGHNPAIEALAHLLSGDGSEEALQHMAGRFPTGALAVIGFEQRKWPGIRPRHGRLIAFHAPGER